MCSLRADLWAKVAGGSFVHVIIVAPRELALTLRGAETPRTSGCLSDDRTRNVERDGGKKGRRLWLRAREGGRLWENRVGHGVARTHASVPAVGGCRVALCRRLRQSS